MVLNRIGVVAVGVAIGVAFLAGYLPQRSARTAAEQQLVTLRAEAAAAADRVRMGQLLGEAIAVREATLRQNYGQAQELSSSFFDGVRQEASASTTADFRSALNDVLARRDAVTAALAKADSDAGESLRAVEVRIRRALGYPVNPSGGN